MVVIIEFRNMIRFGYKENTVLNVKSNAGLGAVQYTAG